jgi:hypothetical protein
MLPVDFDGGEHVYRVHPSDRFGGEVLWSGLEFVMMVALSSKLFKEH